MKFSVVSQVGSEPSIVAPAVGNWARPAEHLYHYRDTLLQKYGFYLVGAASNRLSSSQASHEYCSRVMLPSFIAAGSRTHKVR
jgi:hypothetical protein